MDDEYEDDFLEDEDEEEEEDEGFKTHYQDFFPNGTVIKFKCSQTKPSQYASWQIR